ncbi:hypothetical protein ACM32_05675, partial [Helicobacter pylori]
MFTLRELPFAKDSMGDFLSPVAFDFHHGKHHQTYVNNLNNLIKGTDFEKSSLNKNPKYKALACKGKSLGKSLAF